ncbi:uncharacterized protein LOC123319880 isoform X2 [Coccinella septempunctata]|nr:uncharacterized protein LOC123312378 isoform X2 [Coccinella septempunctata]XP_044752703.1 uncharacterized protein LOC123312378 isoform X2 [Coccinella septempunctata]XP_044762874.1 uncharacterized protein LOC123319880 isoform X2 [Coccinella septempunctata]XP_044762883.1 uncharacterized protein LOC123319880 isoform X2 [Coccinella septempunctata]
MCKHIHAVALVAERSDSVLGVRTVNDDDEDNNLYICQPSTSRAAYEMDVQSVVGGSSQITNDPIDSTTKDIVLEQARMQLGLLDVGTLRNIAKIIRDAYNLQCNNASTSRKRKIEKQLYFPSKK